jgi:hypothetical protein
MISERAKMSHTFEIDDKKLIEKFVQGSNQLIASTNLRLEVNGTVSQLMSRTGESIAFMYLQNKPRSVIIKSNPHFLGIIDPLLIDRDFVMIGDANRTGFVEYKHYVTPAGYRIWYTDPSILWKKWWPTERFQDKQRFNMNILVNFKDNWYPVQNINLNAGTFTIKTIAGHLVLQREGKVLWLAQIMREQLSPPTINDQVEATSVSAPTNQHPPITEFSAQLSSTDLTDKIQQKQSDIDSAQAWNIIEELEQKLQSEQAWKMIKELEQKLQSNIKLNMAMEDKLTRSEHRAIIAEQRLQMVHEYLHKMGVNPQNIYGAKQNIRN